MPTRFRLIQATTRITCVAWSRAKKNFFIRRTIWELSDSTCTRPPIVEINCGQLWQARWPQSILWGIAEHRVLQGDCFAQSRKKGAVFLPTQRLVPQDHSVVGNQRRPLCPIERRG